MSQDPGDRERRPVAPELLGRDAKYYREQAAEVDTLLDALSDEERSDHGLVDRLRKRRELWHQLADELDEYLTADSDSPGLF